MILGMQICVITVLNDNHNCKKILDMFDFLYTVWKLRTFTVTGFWQNFHENNSAFDRELISRNFLVSINLNFSHCVGVPATQILREITELRGRKIL